MRIYHGRHSVNTPSEIEVEALRIEAKPIPGFPANVSIGIDGSILIQNLEYAIDGFSLTAEDVRRLADIAKGPEARGRYYNKIIEAKTVVKPAVVFESDGIEDNYPELPSGENESDWLK